MVVELAHKVDPSNPLQIHIDSIIEKIIFKAPDIIKLEIIDADIDYATRGRYTFLIMKIIIITINHYYYQDL